MEAGDLLLEAYDEQDANNPPATPEAADDRLSGYLAGIATAIAVGTMMAAPRDNVDAEGRDVTPEDLCADAETLDAREADRRAASPRRSGPSSSGTTSPATRSTRPPPRSGCRKSWGSRLHARAIESIGAELRKAGEV